MAYILVRIERLKEASDDLTMKSSLHKRILLREQGDSTLYSSIRGFYGDKAWIDDLDIVNELGGHNGCVNALSYVCAVSIYLNRPQLTELLTKYI